MGFFGFSVLWDQRVPSGNVHDVPQTEKIRKKSVKSSLWKIEGEGWRGHPGPSMTQDPFVLRTEVPASEGPRVNWVFKLCEFKPKGDKKKDGEKM